MTFPKYSYDKFLDLYEQDKAILVDVRSAKDYEAEHIPEAINLPIEDLTADKLVQFQDKTILFHCGGGSRAGKACNKIHSENETLLVASLEGGFRGWKARQA